MVLAWLEFPPVVNLECNSFAGQINTEIKGFNDDDRDDDSDDTNEKSEMTQSILICH